MLDKIKRVIFDFILFLLIIAFFVGRGYFFTIENTALDLLFYKAMLVSAGFLHAHIVRKLAFPYIDFQYSAKHMHLVMIVGLYITIIWAYARGG